MSLSPVFWLTLVSVLFQLCGLLAFGVLSWSTTREPLCPVMCLLAIFEGLFVLFWFFLP